MKESEFRNVTWTAICNVAYSLIHNKHNTNALNTHKITQNISHSYNHDTFFLAFLFYLFIISPNKTRTVWKLVKWGLRSSSLHYEYNISLFKKYKYSSLSISMFISATWLTCLEATCIKTVNSLLQHKLTEWGNQHIKTT